MTEAVSVQSAFARVAERSADDAAIVQGERTVSYRELRARADTIAASIEERGIAPGSLVGILSARPIDVVASVLAVLGRGCAIVPIDAIAPPARIDAMLAVAPPALLIVDAQTRPGAEALRRRGDVLVLDDLDGTPSAQPLSDVVVDPDARCYVFFTSGSTGVPKAIVGRTKSLAHYIRWETTTFALGSGDRTSQLTSAGFDAMLRDVFVPLCTGGTLCIPPDRNLVADPVRLARWLEDAGITVLHTVPSVFRTLLAARLDRTSLPALRYVLLAGEVLPPADVRTWYQLVGDRIELVNLYGATETTMTKLFHRVTPADAERPSIPIGKPMGGARAMIFDGKGKPSGAGTVGEIYVRTPYRSLGYLHRPDLTAAVFVPNPLSDDPADVLYKSGDLGRMDEHGVFEFVGRRDDLVKVNGVRIELGEVELALRLHPSVRDAVVVKVDDAAGGATLCAYVVLKPAVEDAALRGWLAERLTEPMIPSAFVELEILPRTANGKVDRAALDQVQRAAQRGTGVKARTATEKALSAIWEELLQIGPPDVEHNFFTVGGHSLLAMQVLSRVEANLAVTVPLGDFLAAPTIAGLAEYIDAGLLELGDASSDLLALLDAEDATEAPAVG